VNTNPRLDIMLLGVLNLMNTLLTKASSRPLDMIVVLYAIYITNLENLSTTTRIEFDMPSSFLLGSKPVTKSIVIS